MTITNKNVAITGGLKKMDRSQAFSRIELEGGCPKANMSAIVDILVVADSKYGQETTKTRKARELNSHVEIISESAFYDLIGA